jgi:hypothetical protein
MCTQLILASPSRASRTLENQRAELDRDHQAQLNAERAGWAAKQVGVALRCVVLCRELWAAWPERQITMSTSPMLVGSAIDFSVVTYCDWSDTWMACLVDQNQTWAAMSPNAGRSLHRLTLSRD